jgi:hypothetical protein
MQLRCVSFTTGGLVHAVIRFGAAVDKCVDSIESGNVPRN